MLGSVNAVTRATRLRSSMAVMESNPMSRNARRSSSASAEGRFRTVAASSRTRSSTNRWRSAEGRARTFEANSPPETWPAPCASAAASRRTSGISSNSAVARDEV